MLRVGLGLALMTVLAELAPRQALFYLLVSNLRPPNSWSLQVKEMSQVTEVRVGLH